MTVFELWIPIAVAGVATHIWSTLAWTVLPHHKPEWTKVPIEDDLQDLIANKGVPAGQYMFPFASDPKTMASEEFKQKNGKCRGMLVLWQAPLSMGPAIGKTFLFFLVAAFVVGYLCSIALMPGATFMKVFQFSTTAGLLAHCSAIFPHVFWFRRKIAMELMDGVIFAVITGLAFSLLWPAAAT